MFGRSQQVRGLAKAQEMIVCLSAESISSVTIRWGLAELLLASCMRHMEVVDVGVSHNTTRDRLRGT
jgi:hypothetical protein